MLTVITLETTWSDLLNAAIQIMRFANFKMPNLHQQVLTFSLLLVTTIFLWEIAMPFHVLTSIAYLIVIFYLVFKNRYV